MVAQIDRDYLRLGVGRTLRRLVSYACFEGRPATTRGRWINPAVFALLHGIAAAPGKPTVDRPIFITGLGRSGTTVLGMLMSVHREVGFLNEPKALWHVIDPRQDVNGNYGGASPRFRMTAGMADDRACVRAHRLVSRYLKTVGAHRLVDKYPELLFRVDYVRALFPDARFVFIHRHGADCCESIVNWSQRLGRNVGGVQEDWWGRDDCKWNLLWSELIAGDPRFADIAALDPAKLDHLHRAALEWIVTMQEGLRQLAEQPDAVTRVSYESLVARPNEILSGLLQFCDLAADAEATNYAIGRIHDNPSKPMPSLHPVVQRWFDTTLADLGYTN